MKSKKIIALALTAAMAISMASMTAFATSVTYDDTKKPEEITATVEVKDEDVATGTDGKAKTVTVKDLKDSGKLKDLDHQQTKAFRGWALEDDNAKTVLKDDATFEVGKTVLVPVYTDYEDEDEAKDLLKKQEEKKAQEKEDKEREEALEKEDAKHNATDNINTGTKVETGKIVPDSIKTGDDATHALEVAGVKSLADNNEIVFVYDVNPPAGFMKSTKNIRVQLKLPSEYTTTNYKVTVYHIKGWCKAQKVTGLNVGKKDVAFWTNDFSEFVLVLTPTDAVNGTSTGNPGTGDFSAVPVAMLAAAALGATGFVAYKKRKAE